MMNSQEFADTFNTLPRPVRSFIMDGKLDAAVGEIAATYQLHVDVTGRLQDLAMQLLMGRMSPTQVFDELISTGIEAETGKKILEDLNQKVFIPVRQKVEHFQETGEDLISPPDILEEQMEVSTPAGVPSQPISVEQVLPTQPKPTVAPVSTPSSAMVPGPEPVPVAISGTQFPVGVAPTTLPISSIPQYVPPAPINTSPPVITPPVAAMHEVVMPPTSHSAPPPVNLPGTPIEKTYGVDPYRESVE